MQYLKQAISIFLLFIYSIGFAHNVIPHTHIDDFTFKSSHNHAENHKHTSISTIDVVEHKDHLDDSFLDYVLCLFSEMTHDKSYQTDNYFIAFDKESSTVKDLVLIQLFTSFFAQPTIIQSIEITDFINQNTTFKYLTPLLDSFSFRGPPSFSC